MSTDRTVTATFALKQYTLQVTTPGAGRVTGNGIDCGTDGIATFTDCDHVYSHGTSVTLTADPAEPLADTVTWSGDDCSGTGASCDVTMNGDKAVTAAFTLSGP
jgi:hypothetical protein